MQSFGLRTHKKHMTKIDRIPMPYIEPNVADGTKAIKLKKWLERLQQCFEGNYEKDVESMMKKYNSKKRHYASTEKKR